MADKSKSVRAGVVPLWVSNYALAAAGVSCLTFGAISLWRAGDLAAVGTGLTAGLVLLLAATIERFEVLKGLGVEARTRKLDEAITQANATVEQLRGLAASVSRVALAEMMSGHFAYGGMTLSERVKLHDELITTLKKIGVSSTQLTDADSNWREGMAAIYFSHIRQALASSHESGSASKEESEKAASDFNGMLDANTRFVMAPKLMESFISDRGLMRKEIRDWLDDYAHLRQTGEIRRREIFCKE